MKGKLKHGGASTPHTRGLDETSKARWYLSPRFCFCVHASHLRRPVHDCEDSPPTTVCIKREDSVPHTPPHREETCPTSPDTHVHARLTTADPRPNCHRRHAIWSSDTPVPHKVSIFYFGSAQ